MKTSILTLFYEAPKNLLKVFWGKNLLWHIAAIILTLLCVVSGFDWEYYSVTQIAGLRFVLFPAIILGLVLPVIIPLALLIIGAINKNRQTLNTAFALGQAAILGWLVAAFYKAFTGRPGPENLKTLGDITRVFRFGFLRGGVFWGWPSSHATVAFAMGVVLITLYPKNKVVRFWALAYSIYIGVAVSMTIHWFSDFAAGAIFGTLVGLAVGQNFLHRSKFINS